MFGGSPINKSVGQLICECDVDWVRILRNTRRTPERLQIQLIILYNNNKQ